jgi:hypothetical protein
MTLVIGMSKAEGIYMSVDYRVTDAKTGALIDDASIKYLRVYYPPYETGPKALLAFTGVARLQTGLPVGDWLRETLRGKSEVFDVSMQHLRQRLNRDVAPMRRGLIINFLAVHGDRRYVGFLSNLKKPVAGKFNTLNEFAYSVTELTEPFVFANGSGALPAVLDGHLDFVRTQLGVRPRRIQDHMKLLATVNRRVAAAEPAVSPHSHVCFMSGEPGLGSSSGTFTERGESVPFRAPLLLYGADMSGVYELLAHDVEVGQVSPRSEFDEIVAQQKRRP